MNQISLDINKADQIINEPVVLRVGEEDQTITVSLLKDGQPYTSFTTATFFANKPSGAIVANDPANVSNGMITYTVPQALVNEFGKITNAYFLIDGKTSTESFVIAVLQGVNISDDLNDYIPGMSNLNVIYDKWKAKLDGITRELAGIDAPKEVKNVIDSELKNYTNQVNDLKNKITALQTDVNNLKIPKFGINNLIPDSGFESGRSDMGIDVIKATNTFPAPFGKYMAQVRFEPSKDDLSNKDCKRIWRLDKPIYLKANTNYVMSYYYSTAGSAEGYASDFACGKDDKPIFGMMMEHKPHDTSTPPTEFKRFVNYFKLSEDTTIYGFGFGFVRINDGDGWKVIDNVQIQEGTVVTDHVFSEKDKINNFDTNNWQKSKITSDRGGVENSWFASDDVDLKKQLINLPIGFHTFYAQSGVTNNPATPAKSPVRGYIHITDKGDDQTLGNGIMGSLNSDEVWSIHVQYNNGKYDDNSVVFNHLVGMNSNIKLKDSTGKETTYIITGIS